MSIYNVFRHPAFAILWSGRMLTQIATLTQSVAIGWSVYAIARLTHSEKESALLVGIVGFAQFVPMFLLALVAGDAADRYDKRIILVCCGFLQFVCAGIFTILSLRPNPTLEPVFITAGFFGIARAFSMPASTSLLPALIPRDILPRAIAWNTLAVQGGMIIGPWLGGVLCEHNPAFANGTACAFYLAACSTGFLLLRLPINAQPNKNNASRVVMIREGLLHLWGSKIVLGAISLDLFAVLLGGVTALLPAFALDVLHIGPTGFGHLRAAFAAGAGLMTLKLAFKPIERHVGFWMLGGVTIYGIATVAFALSRDVWLSMVLLAVAGSCDSISVFVRQNLVQIMTPDSMKGRVSAVSGLFISASNELGEFESGVAARLLGVVGSAIFGGAGSVLVTVVWGRLFPSLRRADRLVPPEIVKL